MKLTVTFKEYHQNDDNAYYLKETKLTNQSVDNEEDKEDISYILLSKFKHLFYNPNIDLMGYQINIIENQYKNKKKGIDVDIQIKTFTRYSNKTDVPSIFRYLFADHYLEKVLEDILTRDIPKSYFLIGRDGLEADKDLIKRSLIQYFDMLKHVETD